MALRSVSKTRLGPNGLTATGQPAVGVRRAAGGKVAVSYTHFRAHETVPDPVCRLLLEKKNKPTEKKLT